MSITKETGPVSLPGDEGVSKNAAQDPVEEGVGKKSENIEEILRERSRIDELLKEKFQKEITILFTDICGYTQYMDTMADINGLTKLQRHNDIVLPIVKKYDGVLIKMIGDAVMASFSDPLSAVKASIDIQKSLYEHNQKQDARQERIHVKIGINSGSVFADQSDIFGDAVNVASRIQSQAEKDIILISKTVFADIVHNDDIVCRFHGNAQVKGKAEPLELYRILWKPEYAIDSSKKHLPVTPGDKKRGGSIPKVIQLELTREGNHLKISAHEQQAGEMSTIRNYEEISVTLNKVEARCKEIVKTLNNASHKGRLASEAMGKLRELGQVLRDELFTESVKEKLKMTQADHLILNLDNRLVHIPWELLHDGKKFLCQQFNMGRLVKTQQTVIDPGERLLGKPLKMMILANPRGDLKGAYHEGTELRDFLDKNKTLINASLRSDNITCDFVKEKIRNFDFVHFAGHADYNHENPREGGWRLTDGSIRAEEIIKMAGTSTMPAFIFSNACQSATTKEQGIGKNFQDEIFGLANAFILSGVKHYVGTFWEIPDKPSRYFALEFYKYLFDNITIGEALKKARFALIDRYGEESIVWASYVLYGDPSFNYLEQIQHIEPEYETEISDPTLTDKEIQAENATNSFKENGKRKSKKWTGIAAGIVIAISAVLFMVSGFQKKTIEKYEIAAIEFYNMGNFDEAIKASNILEKKSSGSRMAYLIKGDIFFRKGKLTEAQAFYHMALDAEKGTSPQKAQALIGLGRIASLHQKTDASINYYKQATQTDPASAAGYLSQAILMDNSGQSQQAIDILKKARKIAPDNKTLLTLANEIQKKVALAGDNEKQDRVNKLVKELLETLDAQQVQPLPSDGWTSLPLTMLIMDFKTRGFAMQEGEDRLIASGITEQMLQNGRVQIVERALLDKLLEELKLGTSKLTDKRTALSIGKILAARLMLSGQIFYSGPETQITLRLIETETGRITAAANENFKSAMSASDLADKLSENLLKKLKKQYPLRGKIVEIKGEKAVLNIGRNSGVAFDQHFKVPNQDIVFKITEIDQDTSLATLVKGDKTQVAKNLRVEGSLGQP